MGHADRPAARVTVGSAVRPELAQVARVHSDAGLLVELTARSWREVLVDLEEAARQCPLTLERRVATAYDEYVLAPVHRSQRDDIDGDVDAGVVLGHGDQLT